jgi:plasmid stabilization system protein ParE
MNPDAETLPRIEIRPAAEDEAWEAFRWYEDKAEGLGSEFLRAFESCLAFIQENPTASAVVRKDVRRAKLARFPYLLFYVVRDDVLSVIACFHASRNPRDLRERLNDS